MQRAAIISPGQLIRHKLFHYRGVVYDVDPHFMLSEEWYENVAKSRPPKDEPWYRVLVHGTNQETYVAQQNLEPDSSADPIDHPSVDQYFAKFDQGRYLLRTPTN
jgi:heat shock protein HspQ